jgi:Transcriptional regulators
MFTNPTPRYYRIYRLLRQAIEEQQFSSGEAMPGENALAERYGVSRLTIRRSLELLQQEGLIERRQGAGTYVSQAALRSKPLRADFKKLQAHISEMGTSTRVQLLSFQYELPNAEVKTRLELGSNQKVQKAVRVRYTDQGPFSYLTTYVPESIGRRYSAEDLERHAIQDLFHRLGIAPASADQSITAILADVHHAETLGVSAGSALLCIKRCVRDADGHPIEYLIAAYNPERFEYRMDLAHVAGDQHGKGLWVLEDDRSTAAR